MGFFITTIILSSVAFLDGACAEDQCVTVQRMLIDGSVLTALEVKVSDTQRTYVNPTANFNGLSLPVADHRSSDGQYSSIRSLCAVLSNGEYDTAKSTVKARHAYKYLLDGKDWAPEKTDYSYHVNPAFILAGESHFKDENGNFVIASFTKSMRNSSEVIATILCEKS